MDILAHGLWTAVAYSQIKFRDRLWAVFFGIVPDVFSFGLFFIISLFAFGFRLGPPEVNTVPGWVFMMYNIGHSLFVWLLVMGVIWLVRGKLWWPSAGALLHIAIDVPRHEANFFPTPWLWPFSSYTVDGFSWADAQFMIINYAALLIVYASWFMWWRWPLKKVHEISD